VRSGPPSERYDLEFDSIGGGETMCGVGISAATDGSNETRRTELAEAEIGRLLDQTRLAELMRVDLRLPRIPPNSLVGRPEAIRLLLAHRQERRCHVYDPQSRVCAGLKRSATARPSRTSAA
jgi:hypothetical protein